MKASGLYKRMLSVSLDLLLCAIWESQNLVSIVLVQWQRKVLFRKLRNNALSSNITLILSTPCAVQCVPVSYCCTINKVLVIGYTCSRVKGLKYYIKSDKELLRIDICSYKKWAGDLTHDLIHDLSFYCTLKSILCART